MLAKLTSGDGRTVIFPLRYIRVKVNQVPRPACRSDSVRSAGGPGGNRFKFGEAPFAAVAFEAILVAPGENRLLRKAADGLKDSPIRSRRGRPGLLVNLDDEVGDVV